MKLNLITLIVIAVFGFLFFRQAFEMPWTANRIAGLSIAVPALLLLIVARIQLGGAFSFRAKATDLVTSGLYARIRNPIYFFGALFILGIIIWSGRPIFLLIFALLVPIQIARVRKESEVLAAKFGDAYLAYKRRTWF